MKEILFISGGHGVGKTSFCNYLVERYKFVHFTASNLISEKTGTFFSNSKRIEGISENQDILIEAIRDININGKVLLLDGHFCLINLDGKVVRLPAQTFKKLSPTGIIILVDAPQNINARLKARDGESALDEELIKHLQSEEITYGIELANLLGIPLLQHIISKSKDEVDLFIKDLKITEGR